MSTHDRDADLARLLGEAVDDVEPTDRLDEIRARTSSPAPPRRWWYAGGAALAAAAAVTAVAVLGPGTTPSTAPDPADQPSAPSTPGTSPAPDPSPTEPTTPSTLPPVTETFTAAVYYVGETPRGPRLYREFQALPGDGFVPLAPSVRAAVEGDPEDPDYRSPWAGTGAALDRGHRRRRARHGRPHRRPASAAGRPRPGRGRAGRGAGGAHRAGRRRLGGPGAAPPRRPAHRPAARRTRRRAAGPGRGPRRAGPGQHQRPRRGAAGRGRLHRAGPRLLLRGDRAVGGPRRHRHVVLDGFSTAEGWLGRLYPWEAEVDVSGLEPGRYTFVATTSDPSDGESGGPMTDTRTIVVP